MIQVPVTWDSANRKRDKSVSLKFTTNFEITNQDFGEMDKLMGSVGWLLFDPNEDIDTANIPKEPAPVDVGQKKPSLRLRAVIYRIYEQKTDQSEPFDQYYTRIMERIIERYKEELI